MMLPITSTSSILFYVGAPKPFRQTRQCSDGGNNRFWSRVPDKLLPCVPAPPVLSLCGAAGSWAAGWTPASCPGSVWRGGREKWRRLFLYSTMKSRLCLPVSMTTTLLQYSAVGQPLHLKAFPSGVSVALCIFFSRFSPSSSSSSATVCGCFKSSPSSSFSNHTSFASDSRLKFTRLHLWTCSQHTFGCL